MKKTILFLLLAVLFCVACKKDGDTQIGLSKESFLFDSGAHTSGKDENTLLFTLHEYRSWKITVRYSQLPDRYSPWLTISLNQDGTQYTEEIRGFYTGSTQRPIYIITTKNTWDAKRTAWIDITAEYPNNSELQSHYSVEVVQEAPYTEITSLFAGSNIILADDGTLTFNDGTDNTNGTIVRSGIPANSQGLLFKWGSLVAVHGSEIGNSPYVAFTPPEYSDPISKWSEIPTPFFAPMDKLYLDYDSYSLIFIDPDPDVSDALNGATKTGYLSGYGVGDICRYISDKGWVKGYWRIPTTAEYRALTNETAYITTTLSPLGEAINSVGIKSGDQKAFFESQSVSDQTGMARITNGWWVGKAVDNKTNTDANKLTPPANTVFFPASGLRDAVDGDLSYGEFRYPGKTGEYWTAGLTDFNVVADFSPPVSLGQLEFETYFFMFSSIHYAYSVRCIRDIHVGSERKED